MAAGFFRKVKKGLMKFGIGLSKILQNPILTTAANLTVPFLGTAGKAFGGWTEKVLTQGHF